MKPGDIVYARLPNAPPMLVQSVGAVNQGVVTACCVWFDSMDRERGYYWDVASLTSDPIRSEP